MEPVPNFLSFKSRPPAFLMFFLEAGRYFFPFFRKNEEKWWPMDGTFFQISPKTRKNGGLTAVVGTLSRGAPGQ